MSEPSFLSELNPEQRQAAECVEGPLLLSAGAGAGKTKTLVARIAYLISQGVAPENILAVTFTNKAAKEMKERVESLLRLDPGLNSPVTFTGSPTVSTFHALGVSLLRANADRFGLTKHFSIFDRADSKSAIRDSLKELGYDPKQYDPNRVLGVISRAKGEAQDVDEFRESSGIRSPFYQVAAEVWEVYAKRLKGEKALDFDDLLLKTLQLLERCPEVRAYYQDHWHYLHIDEYQDTNFVQYRISRLLAEKHRQLCVVGDTDQLIYGWRGARLENLLSFERDYPEATVLALEQNYRSTQTIINAANRVIEKNIQRQAKRLFTRNATGELLTVADFGSEIEEARFIAATAAEQIAAGAAPEELAVLYRTNVQSRVLEEAFLDRSVPYQILGTRFFERREVKDVLAYIKAALNPDSISDFKRAVNTPSRGIGQVTLARMLNGTENELSPRQQAAAAEFRWLLEGIRREAGRLQPSEFVSFVIRHSGLDAAFQKEGTEDAEERRGNAYELAALAAKYDSLPPEEGLETLLSEAALASDQDQLAENRAGVKLMTVHAAKGLEFNTVFVAGLEQGLFPQSKDEPEEQEEERRLFYVALTRARQKVFLTYAASRSIFGRRESQLPSEFLEDIDDTVAERPDESGDIPHTGLLDDDSPIIRVDL